MLIDLPAADARRALDLLAVINDPRLDALTLALAMALARECPLAQALGLDALDPVGLAAGQLADRHRHERHERDDGDREESPVQDHETLRHPGRGLG